MFYIIKAFLRKNVTIYVILARFVKKKIILSLSSNQIYYTVSQLFNSRRFFAWYSGNKFARLVCVIRARY
jgi:hypothetical protein